MPNLIQIDLTRMLKQNLPQETGVSSGLVREHAQSLQAIQRKLSQMVESDTGTFANTFLRPEVKAVEELASRLEGRFDDFLLIGIGGSTWGTIAIQAALCHSAWNDLERVREGRPRFHFLDNSDPDALNEVLEQFDPARTLVNVVSKSGTTAETAANFMSVVSHFRKVLGDTWNEHFVLTTDEGDGLLQRIGREENVAVLPIPPKTGGRFSLLSAVGLFPAAMLGLDVKALLAGAEDLTRDTAQCPLEENRVMTASVMTWDWFRKGHSVNVVMPYARALRFVANWYVQLWGESLGKKYNNAGEVVHSGSTPLGALGAADQHSLLQLFMEGPADKLVSFIRVESFRNPCAIGSEFAQHEAVAYLGGQQMGRLINVEQESTAEALLKAGRGSRTLQLPEVNAYYLGQLFQFFMLETFINGELMGINTFDQPGVEAGKILTYGGMGRPGFESHQPEHAEELRFN